MAAKTNPRFGNPQRQTAHQVLRVQEPTRSTEQIEITEYDFDEKWAALRDGIKQ